MKNLVWRISHRALSILFITFFLSCTSTTVIKAVNSKGKIDKSVKIYVNGYYLSKGKTRYSDSRAILSAVPSVELARKGCKTQKEKLDTKVSWISSAFGAILFGTGVDMFGRTSFDMVTGGKSNVGAALAVGSVIIVVGLLHILQSRSYVPTQEFEFQCLKVVE